MGVECPNFTINDLKKALKRAGIRSLTSYYYDGEENSPTRVSLDGKICPHNFKSYKEARKFVNEHWLRYLRNREPHRFKNWLKNESE